MAIRTRGASVVVRKTPTGLPDCDEQRLVVLEPPELGDDRVEGLPAARRPAGAAIHDEVVGILGHLGVEVVHEHPQRRLLLPALAGELGAARRADRARTAPGLDGRHAPMIRRAVMGPR